MDAANIGLTIFLIKPSEIAAFEKVILSPANNPIPLMPPLDGVFVPMPSAGSEPEWVHEVRNILLAPIPGQLTSRSAGGLLIVRRNGQTFVVSFGHAWLKLRDDWLEPEFGRRIALNTITPNNVVEIRAEQVFAKWHLASERAPRASSVREFAVEFDRDLVAMIGGKPSNFRVMHIGRYGPKPSTTLLGCATRRCRINWMLNSTLTLRLGQLKRPLCCSLRHNARRKSFWENLTSLADYALLDSSELIRVPHLAAAIAVWDYCEKSARWIFGDALGYPVADAIFTALRQAGASGLTRSEISAFFGRHRSATEITAALQQLSEKTFDQIVGQRVRTWFWDCSNVRIRAERPTEMYAGDLKMIKSVTLCAPKEKLMQKIIMIVLCMSACAWAQNPVSDGLRNELTRQAKNTIAAAEEMPSGKYGYKPTEAQVPFGHWVSHATGANYFFCSKLTGATAPEVSVKETDPKDKLVEALKRSFDYCSTQLPTLQDNHLGEEVAMFGGRKMTKAAAVLDLSADWADHYSQMASYLRLNGLLPPTAKKK